MASSVYFLSLLFFEQCLLVSLEFTVGVREPTSGPRARKSHLPRVLLACFQLTVVYLGSVFVSFLKIASRFEVQENGGILELG